MSMMIVIKLVEISKAKRAVYNGKLRIAAYVNKT